MPAVERAVFGNPTPPYLLETLALMMFSRLFQAHR